MFEGCVFLGENGLSFIVMESPAIRYYTKSQAYICPSFWYNTTIGSILGGWWVFLLEFFGSGVETHSMRLYFLVLLLRHTVVWLYFCSFFVVFSVLAWRRIQCVFTFFGFVVETHGCVSLLFWFFFGFFGSGVETHSMRLYFFLVLLLRYTAVCLYGLWFFCGFFGSGVETHSMRLYFFWFCC